MKTQNLAKIYLSIYICHFIVLSCSVKERIDHRFSVAQHAHCEKKPTALNSIGFRLANVGVYTGTTVGDVYIKTIIDRSCGVGTFCHGPDSGARRTLFDYTTINDAVKMMQVIARVKIAAGVPLTMPQDGSGFPRLSTDEIALLDNWNENGRPERAIIRPPLVTPTPEVLTPSPTPAPEISPKPEHADIEPIKQIEDESPCLE